MKSIEDRFWEKVKIQGPDDCWEWIGAINGGGYGVFFKEGVTVLAHRLVWWLSNDDVPNGLCVLHKCDNRKCVNINHLFLGTYADNHVDMDIKGRRVPGRGERHRKAKLTNEDVINIRAIREYTGAKYKEIALIFGVASTTIGHIVRRINWQHI